MVELETNCSTGIERAYNNVVDIVLIHGWGLNSGIWSEFIQLAEQCAPELRFHSIDLPGYGSLASEPSSSSLRELALSCLSRAPEKAIWVGWSLGGMVALKAAMLDLGPAVRGLYLIASSPCFVAKAGWQYGVDLEIFERFSKEFSESYSTALSMFLLLQSGANKGARKLAKQAHAAVCEFSDPSETTLKQGLECLARTDLRQDLMGSEALRVLPSRVVSCRLDRVANPEGGRVLAETIEAEFVQIKTGHAPFLSAPQTVLKDLTEFVAGAA